MYQPDTQPDAQTAAQSRDLVAENEALRARMSYVMEQARRNHEIMSRHQAFDLEIVGASTFTELVGTIFRMLPIISELDTVTLSLVDPDADIYTVMYKLGVDFEALPDLLFCEHAVCLGFESYEGERLRPRLGPYTRAEHHASFPHPPTGLQSVALVPLLRNKRLIGSLNLGSTDIQRFTRALGTDFVEHMASIIAICLENVISNEMLKYMGLTDALTGVYNRRYIDRRLVEEVARARRQDYCISVMFIDVDHFKSVNDRVGHQAGDDVLREVAARIKMELRVSDALARFGGEEFVVLLIDADLAAAAMVAERIRAGVVGKPFDLAGGQGMNVSVSIGVSALDDAACELPIEVVAQQLVALADGALYQAKEAGRNRVVRAE
ncbi:sensor domain-containing diguanylate cyclase [Massilia niabensis]|uniref:diguanylate cyclase n=1 Tax=Massilia niabensis TaxID=544910 RepID=A0ABW0L1R0_9BURK